MARILVTGASGLLGSALVPYLRACSYQVVTHGHRAQADYNLDLSHAAPTWAMLDACAPDVVINLAALTNVDTCEQEPQQAYLLNVKVVENLAAWMRQGASQVQRDCYLVQISSDQVYDCTGTHLGPYVEDEVTIKNTYAFSKIAAELATMQVAGCALRTNFFGKSARAGRSSFTDWLAQAMRTATPIEVFDDVLFSPLSMHTLVRMLALVVAQRPHGVFNLGSRAGMSKADFAFAFAKAAGLDTSQVSRISSAASNKLKAYRPKDMRMDCRRFEEAMHLTLPNLAQEIELCGREYVEAS